MLLLFVAFSGNSITKQNLQASSQVASSIAGVVLCIPYTHMNDVGGPDFAQPSTSAAAHGDSYELIAALTRVRGMLFGEDFHQFLRGGATQRYSLTTYLDLFCYQPPEHRCAHHNKLLHVHSHTWWSCHVTACNTVACPLFALIA